MLKVKTSYGTLSITTDMTGKMNGMGSINTSCLVNSFCLAHRNTKGSICQGCFAFRQLKRYLSQDVVYQENMKTLSSGIIPMEELPFLNYGYFRIEAFGDIENLNQCINYLNLIKKNPHCNFAWWTKNPIILNLALKKLDNKKPKNLQVILSSLYTNKPQANQFWFVDKVFTVYDKEFIKQNNININCGARNCLGCLKCYKKNSIKDIKEQLK